jgi:hypothetical protein
MKIELGEWQIRNTLFFLGQVDLRGSKPEVLMEMASLLKAYGNAVAPRPSMPTNQSPPAPSGDGLVHDEMPSSTG